MQARGPQDAPQGHIRAAMDAAGIPKEPVAALLEGSYSCSQLPSGTEVLDCGKYIVTVGEAQVWWHKADLERWRTRVRQATTGSPEAGPSEEAPCTRS